jgi:hypothetical protein
MTTYTIWQEGREPASCEGTSEAARTLTERGRDGYAELRAGKRRSGRLIATAGKKEAEE